MTSARDLATERQVEAADPSSSTWLSANAGSGKTRVLTDRVARLLLGGTPPENILCLTFTKAAASEMQNRLFQRLGAWAMKDDADLASALSELGVSSGLDSTLLARARRLFARAIETPGGLKIQTIHAFCASILRRFPLEADLSPGFREMTERQKTELRSETLNTIATESAEVIARVTARGSDDDLVNLCQAIEKHRRHFPPQPEMGRAQALHGLTPETDLAKLNATLIDALPDADAQAIADTLASQSKTMKTLAENLRAFATNGPNDTTLTALRKALLYATGELADTPKPSALTKGARSALGALCDEFEAFQNAFADYVDATKAIAAAERTHDLHRFAAIYLRLTEDAKRARGWLDFDDLIERTAALLSQPGVADWVLYRLDGDIDHILVDEAQDTSPSQWQVIERLTQEMTAGEGADDSRRKTLFVVGDRKQSIYSFQGADPAAFADMRDAFSHGLATVGQSLNQTELQYSFRSASPILSLVDHTFPRPEAPGLGHVHHLAFRHGMPGRVDLWPAIEPASTSEDHPWTDPAGVIREDHHHVTMAEQVATEIARMIQHEVLWDGDEEKGYSPRPIHAGDVLVLVQSRGPQFDEIINACKARDLPIAGADVLRLGEELVTKDLLALLSFLSTPDDDLSLAAILRSPLFGWTEAQLFDLAATRPEGTRLWQQLRTRAQEFPDTHARLSALRDDADFRRPYDLLEQVLTEQDGRRRILGRLGQEASDAMDALLAEALSYEQEEAPSLTGFLARMEGTQIDVKRRAEARGRKIRVMTIHGAKGLESPIVILPDCAHQRRRRQVTDPVLQSPGGTPIHRPGSEEMPSATRSLRNAVSEARWEEGQRLLYVALTRAEQWLIVGASGDLGKGQDNWYEQVQAGLSEIGAAPHSFASGSGARLEYGDWSKPVDRSPTRATSLPDLPPWATQTAPTPQRPVQPVSPSDLGGAKALPGAHEDTTDDVLARGTQLHRLLEHLPAHPMSEWPNLAKRLLPNVSEVGDLLAEARSVLTAPHLAQIFAPDTLREVSIVAPLEQLGDRIISGAIDRLLITSDRVTAVDFKSNRTVPTSAADVPEGLLRQMGAYRAALQHLYPDREIDTALIWTATAELMSLPSRLTDPALLRAGDALP